MPLQVSYLAGEHSNTAFNHFKMTTTNDLAQFLHHQDDALDDSDSSESLESLDTDDGQAHFPEKILAERSVATSTSIKPWYLLKWRGASILRSSWQCRAEIKFLQGNWLEPTLLADWELEKERHIKGEAKALDLVAFNNAVADVERAERQRRVLKTFKTKVTRVLSILTAS